MKKSILGCMFTIVLLMGCGNNQNEEMVSSNDIEDAITEELIMESEDGIVEQQMKPEKVDDKYLLINVIGKEKGNVIFQGDKFWVLSDYLDDVGNIHTYYMCIDSDLNIYSKVIAEKFSGDYRVSDYISESALLLYSPGAEMEYYISDLEGNNISAQYISENEKILGLFRDDNGINIFTALAEETVSSQNIIFKVYDAQQNIKLEFSKTDLENKYGVNLGLKYKELDIRQYGDNNYLIENLNQNSNDTFLFVDTARNKAFVAGFPRVVSPLGASNAYQMKSENYIFDIESEIIHEFPTIWFNNCPVTAYSRISNNCFLTDANGHCAIFDISGNMIRDLKEENSRLTEYTDFYDGYMLVEYSNNAGTTFLTVIDTTGEWQFTPVPGTIKHIDRYIKETEQFIAWDNDYKNTLLIDRFGNIDTLAISTNDFLILKKESETSYLVWRQKDPLPFIIIQSNK